MKTINDFNFKDQKALVRVDFNVPLNDQGQITDATRIEMVKPTIEKILSDGGRVVMMSHFGRPKNKEPEFSLEQIVEKVSEVLNKPVAFVPDCVGEEAEKAANNLSNGELLLLENLRYYPEETQGDENFAQQLARLGDIYVNDAFGAAHRAHASTTTIAQFFDSKKCFGKLMEAELRSIDQVLHQSKKPVTAIIGGAKVSSKITIIENILDKINHLIVGGGMSFTFIKAIGGQVGDSLVEEEYLTTALNILAKAKEKQVQVHLPVDAVIANSFSESASTDTCIVTKIPEGWMGLDTGPKTNEIFATIIGLSNTILWNGPVGVFEMEPFAAGTKALGEAIIQATQGGAYSLVGGGDSVAAVKKFGFQNQVSYVSTGGGAMLEALEGKTLPGVAAIGL
jgi:phosphoglycerate kinase